MDALLLFVLFLLFYLVPSIVASLREHRQVVAITVLNVLLGWSLIGWAIALVWALTNSAERPRHNRPEF